MRRVRALPALLGAVALACAERPPEFGVSVFAADTLPVVFTVSLSGPLVMGLRSQSFQMRPDKSLMMSTPAELIIQSGDGTALITSLSGGRLVVQPLGVNPDSADTSSAVGLSVKLLRTGEQRSVQLAIEKP